MNRGVESSQSSLDSPVVLTYRVLYLLFKMPSLTCFSQLLYIFAKKLRRLSLRQVSEIDVSDLLWDLLSLNHTPI